MLKKIKLRILIRRMHKYYKKEERAKQFVNYDKAKNILLLFERHDTEKNLETQKMIQLLTEEGKKITAWGYVDKKDTLGLVDPNCRILHLKDFTILGKPKANILTDLLAQEYDLLIDISTKSYIPMDYLVLYARAKCKTGMYKSGVNLYDFSIDLNCFLQENEIDIDNLEYSFLFNQIIFYLKSIQTKD